MNQVSWLNEDDSERWDRFVENHPNGTLGQTSIWKKVIESSFPHIRCQICALVDRESQDILAGIPLYTVRSWLLGRRLVSVPFSTLGNVLVSGTDDLAALGPAMLKQQVLRHARSIEIRTQNDLPVLNQLGFGTAVPHKHHYLRLNEPPDALLARFHNSSIRQRLTRAKRKGFTLMKGEDLNHLKVFYGLIEQSRKRLGLPLIPLKFFRELWDALYPHHLMVLIATLDGRPVGAALILKYNRTFLLDYLADEAGLRPDGIAQFIYWKAINIAHETGFEVFSFGRTAIWNSGLMNFKNCWGTTVEDLPVLLYPSRLAERQERNRSTVSYRLVSVLAKAMPQPLYRLLGEFCYKHMG